ncbi:MAG: hypothetical protein ACK4E9_18955 [Aeromonas media]
MEHHKTDKAPPDLNELKEQIALEYGRSLLQLQQFELMLKAALPTLKVSGFSDELARNVERDRQLLGGKTLGHLVGQWSQRTTLENEQEIDDDALNGRAYFRVSFGLGRVRISTLHNETEKFSSLNPNTYKGAFLCLVTYSHLP